MCFSVVLILLRHARAVCAGAVRDASRTMHEAGVAFEAAGWFAHISCWCLRRVLALPIYEVKSHHPWSMASQAPWKFRMWIAPNWQHLWPRPETDTSSCSCMVGYEGEILDFTEVMTLNTSFASKLISSLFPTTSTEASYKWPKIPVKIFLGIARFKYAGGM